MPKPRPALQKAPDAGLHPALTPDSALALPEAANAGKTGKKNSKEASEGKAKPELAKKDSAKKNSAKKQAAGKSGQKSAKTYKKQRKSRERAFLSAGKTTSDSIITSKPGSDDVLLKVSMPKPLRKEIRRRAAQSGKSVDDFVTDVLAAWLGDGRWW